MNNNNIANLCFYFLFSALFVDLTSFYVLQTEVSLWDPSMYIH